MFTQEKLKKLHKILTSKISKASKKLSLNLKIKKARDSAYKKKDMNMKSKSVKNKRYRINKSKSSNHRKKNYLNDKSFQNNISDLSEINQKEENFNESFASYLTDNNFIHKNKIKNVTIIKNNTKELYDKSLFFHIMKYYITKSNRNHIKVDNLNFILKPMKSFLINSSKNDSNNSINEKTKYIYYDDKFNLTFGKSVHNSKIEKNDNKNNLIKNNNINNLNLMNNQIFNNNFIFNINNYKSNISQAKNKNFKEIINEENTPSFHNENKEDDKKKNNINKMAQQKKPNLSKNYINIEELKLNSHILQNLIHKKKAMENSKNKIVNQNTSKNSETPRTKSFNKKSNLLEEINKRIKTNYNINKEIKGKK